MTDKEKLIELIGGTRYGIENRSTVGVNFQRGFIEKIANYLLANGVTFTPAIPGPSDADPNIMELCFHNGERHMKEKSILLLDAFDKDYTCGDPYIEYDALRMAMMDL
jgi:hypothetical protein